MKPAIDTYNEIIPPLDYSFCGVEQIADMNDEEPRPPISPRGKGKQRVQQEGSKSDGRCLKFNNNSITNLECLIDFAQLKFTDWTEIAWIDLSHNELTKIGPVSITILGGSFRMNK
ncbi:leucine-rich repeat-containing protein 51-like isoform X2 [Mercenaria mercenaria]|nr:leucine-rich repeat-containing protein 51-like isoform X2 [Mercenaria mercenaria]